MSSNRLCAALAVVAACGEGGDVEEVHPQLRIDVEIDAARVTVSVIEVERPDACNYVGFPLPGTVSSLGDAPQCADPAPAAWIERVDLRAGGQVLVSQPFGMPYPRYLLVPRELRLTAWSILYPAWVREANIVSENLQKGEAGDVVVVPEWIDTNNWAAVCDPRLAPAGNMTSEERERWTAGIADDGPGRAPVPAADSREAA